MRGDESGDPGLQRFAEIGCGSRRTLDGSREAIAPLADRGLDLPEELAGADELLPAREYLAAKKGAVGHSVLDLAVGSLELLVDGAPQTVLCRALFVGRLGEPARAVTQRGNSAPQRLADDDGSRTGVGREGVEPCLEARHGLLRKMTLGGQGGLGDGEHGGGGETLLAQHRHQVRANLLDRLGWHAVEDDRDGRAPLRGCAEQVPRHGIGVAGGRGDEEPKIGGSEQLPGEFAVGLDHGVDVGGVEQRHPRRQGGRADQSHGAGLRLGGLGARDPRQSGQDAVVREPVSVIGVVDEHWPRRRRPNDPGAGDLRPDQGVHEGRLPSTGGATDDSQERCIEGAKPGQNVVVELAKEGDAVLLGLVSAGERQGQRGLQRLHAGCPRRRRAAGSAGGSSHGPSLMGCSLATRARRDGPHGRVAGGRTLQRPRQDSNLRPRD